MDDNLAQKLKKGKEELEVLQSLLHAKHEEVFGLLTRSLSILIDPMTDIHMQKEIRLMMKERRDSSEAAASALIEKLIKRHGDK